MLMILAGVVLVVVIALLVPVIKMSQYDGVVSCHLSVVSRRPDVQLTTDN